MVFDVESIGLHGEGFAWGFVVVDRSGKELDARSFVSDPHNSEGSVSGRQWVKANVPMPIYSRGHAARDARELFWGWWEKWKGQGAALAADCPWPVEARFLAACVDDARPKYRGPAPDDGPRGFGGPYPLIDVASVRLAAGFDPLATVDRLPDELPVHDPLADARQSARLLIEALNHQ